MSKKAARESPAEEVTRLRGALSESERSSRLLVDSIPGLVALLGGGRSSSNSSIARSSNTPDGRSRS